MPVRSDFPPDFAFGVAAAAYQTEGGWNAHCKGPSIWDDFTVRKASKLRGQSGQVATDFYNRYEADLDVAQAMGIDAFRWSIAWSRVLPEGIGKPNQAGLDFYDRLTDACLARGIAPWVTLYHWDLPLALERRGGWTNRDILAWLEEFTHLMAKHLGDRVINWMVLNEPMVFTGAGYFLGMHAPGRRGFSNFIPTMHHAALAMGVGGRVLRAMLPKSARIGTTFSSSWVEPVADTPRHHAAAQRVDALLNRLYLEPILGMGYPLAQLPRLQQVEKYMHAADEANLPFAFDFLGLQLYTRELVAYSWYTPYIRAKLVHPKHRTDHYTLMNWEIHPPALYNMLQRWAAYPNMPDIYVTENGAAFEDTLTDGAVVDPNRLAYLQQHLDEVARMTKKTDKVKGYFVWTFTDNFEWAEGYRPRFGLVHVDFATQQRTLKASGAWYGQFLRDP